MKSVCLLGSTGSIGVSTLDVIRLNKNAYRVVALTANKNIGRLLEQCIEFKPTYAVVQMLSLQMRLEGNWNALTHVKPKCYLAWIL